MSAGSLGDFLDAFAAALAGGAATQAEAAALALQPGFAVYRNSVVRGSVDALVANYPAVLSLVGEEWLRAAAATFASAHPPRDPCLVRYGEDFPQFLASFGPARELPYLADVAVLDRCWTEAFIARGEPALRAADLAALAPGRLAKTVLRPHAAARWRWFGDAPIAVIWSRNRTGESEADLSDIAWRGAGVLIARPASDVVHVFIDRAACAFLDACRAGRTVEDAALRVLAVDARTDFAAMTARLLAAGAFAALHA